MKPIHILIYIFISCFSSTIIHAQNGSLDLTFGNGGKVVTNFGYSSFARSVAIQADGKIVVAGDAKSANHNNIALVRYTTNGLPDITFGNGGKVITDIDTLALAVSVAIQADGKILVFAQNSGLNIALVRYQTDGTLDNSFGIGGKALIHILFMQIDNFALAIQPDGKIVAVGASNNGTNNNFFVARCKTNGTLDSTFGNAGTVSTPIGANGSNALAVALQADGKIVAAGYASNGSDNDFALVRYNTNGTLDNTFGNGGIQTSPIGLLDELCNSVVIQNDGKIIAGGYVINNLPSGRDFAMARYHTDGTLDNQFGNGGKVIYTTDSVDISKAIGLLPTGKIVQAGQRNTNTGIDFVLTCYNTDGTADNTFGNAGSLTADIAGNDACTALAVQADGKIVMVGSSKDGANYNNFTVVRVNYDPPIAEGIENFSSPQNTLLASPNPFTQYTTLHFATAFQDATLVVYNLVGQQVIELNHLSGNKITLHRQHLPMGLYRAELIQNKKQIATGQIMVSN